MKIYFAHPAFTEKQRGFKEQFLERFRAGLDMKQQERNVDLPEIVDPFAYAPDVEGEKDEKDQATRAIASICLRLLQDVSLIVAAVDDNDAGVAFELGFAAALGIPTILFSEGEAAGNANAMLSGTAQACLPHILNDETMGLFVDLIYGFAASEKDSWTE